MFSWIENPQWAEKENEITLSNLEMVLPFSVCCCVMIASPAQTWDALGPWQQASGLALSPQGQRC